MNNENNSCKLSLNYCFYTLFAELYSLIYCCYKLTIIPLVGKHGTHSTLAVYFKINFILSATITAALNGENSQFRMRSGVELD